MIVWRSRVVTKVVVDGGRWVVRGANIGGPHQMSPGILAYGSLPEAAGTCSEFRPETHERFLALVSSPRCLSEIVVPTTDPDVLHRVLRAVPSLSGILLKTGNSTRRATSKYALFLYAMFGTTMPEMPRHPWQPL